MLSDEQLEAAVRALSDPERFEGAERLVAAAAPQLQRILGQALHEGGWFGAAHESRGPLGSGGTRRGRAHYSIETLLAEETRLGMLVGVAVGWQLAGELGNQNDTEGD